MARRDPALRRPGTQARTYAFRRDLGASDPSRGVARGIAPGRQDMPEPGMHGAEESDGSIVTMKQANKPPEGGAESAERRLPANGNPESQSTGRTQSRKAVSQAVDRIRKYVRRNPNERLTAVLHHITPDALKAAFHRLKRGAAPGVDGVRWEDYEQGLDGRLADLWQRIQQGTYRAVPVRRVRIPKPDGGERPLGIAALEDKIVQRALVDVVLNPIYEEEFLGFSYGFRPGARGA